MIARRTLSKEVRRTVRTKRLRMRVQDREVTVWCRDTSSDAEVLREVFLDRAYPVEQALRERSEPTVLDLGANTGLTSVLFSALAPRARVVAVEPLPHNLAVLLANAGEPWHRPWQVVPAAISGETGEADFYWSGWYSSGTLHADIAGTRQGNPHRQEHRQAMRPIRVATTTVQDLVDELGISDIDLVKVDIEGAEEKLFAGDPAWLHRTRCVAIDVHDRYIDGNSVREQLRLAGFRQVAQADRTAVFLR